jgi:uncharacterized protein (DUF2384 family)
MSDHENEPVRVEPGALGELFAKDSSWGIKVIAEDEAWSLLMDVFDDEAQAVLLGVDPLELKQVRADDDRLPEELGKRLLFVADVVGDLAGAYNAKGIKRWFERPRTQLEQRAPRDVLRGDWAPKEAGPQRVRTLAAELSLNALLLLHRAARRHLLLIFNGDEENIELWLNANDAGVGGVPSELLKTTEGAEKVVSYLSRFTEGGPSGS